MNSIGHLFRLTTFGESHGVAIGGIVDGMPSGVRIDIEAIQASMARRRPGNRLLTSTRKESDTVTLLSGIFEGKTLGTPIGFIIKNEDMRSGDYDHLNHVFRPNHADECYYRKYHHYDYRGGGRSSARETACRVVAGALAMQVLKPRGVRILAQLEEAGGKRDKAFSAIQEARSAGDSVGGIVKCTISGVCPNLGEPVYNKLSAALAGAMMSINAARGFELGGGFSMAQIRGTEAVKTDLNGGILGGISTGQDISFRVAFKPTPTLGVPVMGRNPAGEEVPIKPKGRHDPCVAVRAVPVIEAMAAMTILDFMLMNNAYEGL